MEMRYWAKRAEGPEWILMNYMNMTDYAYRHTDLGMLDIECADLPEDERLDAAAEGILSERPKEVMKVYAEDMAAFLDGFFNMPASGMYKGRVNEGKVTDLSEKEGFKALFVDADRYMAEDFVKDGGHAWDGILGGYPLRFIKDERGHISLIQTLSDVEHRRIYKAYIMRDAPPLPDESSAVPAVPRTSAPKLFMLCHSAVELPIGE